MREKPVFWCAALVVLLLDQAAKYLIQLKLVPYKSVPVLNGIFHITYIRNTGAAFGLFGGFRIPLVIVGIAVSAAVIYFHFRTQQRLGLQAPLGLILGGSAGNLVDRIFRSYVIDFIDFKFWPAFNVADIAVNLGILLILIRLFLRKEPV